jgi:hypothetical protein
MPHIVLLGDSVFDNAAYVGSAPDVVEQLRQLLPQGLRASLHARDGASIADIPSQLAALPKDGTHLAISIGGNDALMSAGALEEAARSMAGALERLEQLRARFQQAYAQMLDDVLSRRLATVVCTIYEPRYPDLRLRRLAATALTLLNDAISREAFARGVALIDLRLICNEDADFANPIEPAARGGAKIARAIASFVTGGAPSSGVFAR